MATDIIEKEIKDLLQHLGSGIVVLEKTENSDLLPIAKPSEAEFFERLFSPDGIFFSLYHELSLGSRPSRPYLNLIAGRMYFCQNVADRHIYSVGMRKEYVIEGGKLAKKRRITPDNILLLLSAPFDTFKQAYSSIVTAFKANESLKEFVNLSASSKSGISWDTGDPCAVAESSLASALECMRFSFISSIAYSLKIKVGDSEAWANCEAEELQKMLASSNEKDALKEYGHCARNLYAISEPRFSEDPSGFKEFAFSPVPKNRYMRWRENCKFLAARFLSERRQAYLSIGKKSGLGDLVFFLKTSELSRAKELSKTAEARRKLFLEYAKADLPPQILATDGKLIGEATSGEIRGVPVAGHGKVTGRAAVANSRDDYTKDLDGKIIISKSLVPDLVELYDKIIGVVSASGGTLAHAAVIAREMNLPCIVQAKNLERIKDGDLIEMDGKSGLVTIIESG